MINVNNATKTKENFDVTNEIVGMRLLLWFIHSFFKCNLLIGYYWLIFLLLEFVNIYFLYVNISY